MKSIVLHRGRNRFATRILKEISSVDYNFDFRGFQKGNSLFNLFWLLLKAWITSKEVPEAEKYVIEGGLVFWVGYFLKKRHPKTKLIIIIPEPAFYLDARKGRLQKLFFSLRMKAMRNTVDHFIFISEMVKESALPWIGDTSYEVIPFYIQHVQSIQRLVHKNPGHNLLFVAERPNDTGNIKGLDLAVQIFERLQCKRKDVKLRIIGSGTEHLRFDNPNIEPLGFVNLTEVFSKTSICILPARYDAFPLIVPEAALHGIIPLISNFVGSKEILKQVDERLVVDSLDLDEWVKRIETYLDATDPIRDQIYSQLKLRFEELTEERVIGRYKQAVAQR